MAATGKKYLTDTLFSDGKNASAKNFPYKQHKTVITLTKSTLKFLLCKFKSFYCADLRIFVVQKIGYHVPGTHRGGFFFSQRPVPQICGSLPRRITGRQGLPSAGRRKEIVVNSYLQ
jgi:hypothetical protein